MLLCYRSGDTKKSASHETAEPKATHAYEDFADGPAGAGQAENSTVEMQTYTDEAQTAEIETSEAETA